MKTMKTKLILLCCAFAATAAFAGDKPAVIQFKNLQTKLNANKDKVIAVQGGVDLVSEKLGMFTIADPSDAGCGDGCAKASIVAKLPESLKAQLPKPKDEVIAVGKLELTDRGYTIAVSDLTVGKEAVEKFGK